MGSPKIIESIISTINFSPNDILGMETRISLEP